MKNFLRNNKLFKNLTTLGNIPIIPRRILLCFFGSIVSPFILPLFSKSLRRIGGDTLRQISFVLMLLFAIGNVSKSQIVINEIGIAPTSGNGSGGEFIELFNKGGCTIDLSCYTLIFSSTSGSGSATGWT